MHSNNRISKIILLILLLGLTGIVLCPLLIMIYGSFKDPLEVIAFNLELPKVWHFENYLQVIKEGKVGRAFFNSMLISSLAVSLTIFISSMASFIIARRNSRVSNFLYYFLFLGTLLPMQIVPTIKIFQSIQLYGSYISVILIYCAINISFSCFLYIGFIRGINRSLDEAAMIEGASVFEVFFRIIFPLLKPINMTILVIVFMNIWNDINIPLYFLPNSSKWTMPLSVYNFFGQYAGSNWNLVFADLTLTAIPVIILYLFAQRHIVAGLTSGAVKQ